PDANAAPGAPPAKPAAVALIALGSIGAEPSIIAWDRTYSPPCTTASWAWPTAPGTQPPSANPSIELSLFRPFDAPLRMPFPSPTTLLKPPTMSSMYRLIVSKIGLMTWFHASEITLRMPCHAGSIPSCHSDSANDLMSLIPDLTASQTGLITFDQAHWMMAPMPRHPGSITLCHSHRAAAPIASSAGLNALSHSHMATAP